MSKRIDPTLITLDLLIVECRRLSEKLELFAQQTGTPRSTKVSRIDRTLVTLKRIAEVAEVDERTLRKWLRKKPVRFAIERRIERACRELGVVLE